MESGTRDVHVQFVELVDRLVSIRSKQMQKSYLKGTVVPPICSAPALITSKT